MSKFKCLNCNKDLPLYDSKNASELCFKDGERVYCSAKCARIHVKKITPKHAVCQYCGADMVVKANVNTGRTCVQCSKDKKALRDKLRREKVRDEKIAAGTYKQRTKYTVSFTSDTCMLCGKTGRVSTRSKKKICVDCMPAYSKTYAGKNGGERKKSKCTVENYMSIIGDLKIEIADLEYSVSKAKERQVEYVENLNFSKLMQTETQINDLEKTIEIHKKKILMYENKISKLTSK